MNKVFEIGTRIVNAYGESGKVVDRMYSEKEKTYYYGVQYDTHEEDEVLLAKGDELKKETEDVEYSVETEILNNVCIVRLYRGKGDIKREVARGHGHIIHEGDIGVAQALSYAFKKAYEKINNGNL